MALKDLVVRGPKPKVKIKRPYESVIEPIHTDDDLTWLYAEKKHLLIVHEIRDARGAYIQTVQVPVKWTHINTAVSHRKVDAKK